MPRLVAVVLLLAMVPVAACGPHVCNMPADLGPYVDLNVAAWRTVHPTALLTVCLDDNCSSPRRTQTEVEVQTFSADRPLDRPRTLRAVAVDNGRLLFDTAIVVRLAEVKHEGACPYSEWTRQVTLDKQGHLHSA